MPRVSVLIPCRDAGPYLDAALDSMARQTFRDLEVIAVDDGSSDSTGDILEARAAADPRLRVLHTPPLGIVPALQLATRHASGELIARMDADDVAEPARIERQVALLDAAPGIAACGTRVRYFPREFVRDGALRYERWLNALVTPGDLMRDLFVECPIAHPTLVARRAAVEAVGGYRDAPWPEDYDLVMRLAEAGHRLANVPEVLLNWRESRGRSSRVDPRYAPDAFRRCKVHYLKRMLLGGRDGVVVCGAGPVGKQFARELLRQGVALRGFVDVDPRKIGQEVYGVRVVPPAAIHAFRGAFAVGAVGSPGARDEIRAMLDAAGWREMLEYCIVA